jgi:DNA-binding transcriptional LysR family regulator
VDRLAAMQTFVKVIETGSFSGAARRLRVGQPAVSKMVALLEERLGTSLLLRSSRSCSAAEAGRIFHERAKLAIARADEAELAARGAGAGLAGRLRISAAVTFARLKIVPRLGRFLVLHPKLERSAWRSTAASRATAAEPVREAALAEFGLAVTSDAMLGVEPGSGAVREVLGEWRLPSIDIWAVFPAGRRASAKASAFAAFVERELAAEAVEQ